MTVDRTYLTMLEELHDLNPPDPDLDQDQEGEVEETTDRDE